MKAKDLAAIMPQKSADLRSALQTISYFGLIDETEINDLLLRGLRTEYEVINRRNAACTKRQRIIRRKARDINYRAWRASL